MHSSNKYLVILKASAVFRQKGYGKHTREDRFYDSFRVRKIVYQDYEDIKYVKIINPTESSSKEVLELTECEYTELIKTAPNQHIVATPTGYNLDREKFYYEEVYNLIDGVTFYISEFKGDDQDEPFYRKTFETSKEIRQVINLGDISLNDILDKRLYMEENRTLID